MPDRIEAGTYLVAALITDGELYLENCSMYDLDAVVYKLREMGAWIQEGKSGVLVKRGAKLEGSGRDDAALSRISHGHAGPDHGPDGLGS
jgi:UDP-N-acetylglucosamine enolpyruvyl transferase